MKDYFILGYHTKKIIIISLFLFVVIKANSQNNAYIDSLNVELKKSDGDIEKKLDLLYQLSEIYRVNEIYEKAFESTNEGISLAESHKNRLKKTMFYAMLAVIYTNQDKYDEAAIEVKNAFESAKKDNLALAYAHFSQATLKNKIEDFENALINCQNALDLIDIEKEPLLASRIYYILYVIYTEWYDVKKTLDYAQLNVELAEKTSDINRRSNAYIALGVAYTYVYEDEKNEQNLENIFGTLEEAIDYYLKYPGRVASNTYAIARLNRASYYLRFSEKNNATFEKINEDISEILHISRELQNSKHVIASCYGILSDIAMMQNNAKLAENYLNNAYSIMLTEEKPYYYTMINIVRGLSNLYKYNGDYKKALEFQEKVTEYNNKLFNQSKAEKVKKLEAQYESKKKDQEMIVLQERTKSHKRQQLLYFGLALLALVGAFFMFRSYHYNLRFSLEREKKLESEKHEAEMQIELEKEEQARLIAEQNLLELKQKQLHDEVMVSQLQLQHKNEVFQQLKEKLSTESTPNIKQILREENMTDNDFEQAKFRIQEVHPNFFKILNEKATQKLTPLDLKYCAYFYLGINTKQISQLLNVEAKSVRMTKYRLKQKFNLDKDTDLVIFLQELGDT